MQSDSDSDNEFFDATEKLSLSGSFVADPSEQKDSRVFQKGVSYATTLVEDDESIKQVEDSANQDTPMIIESNEPGISNLEGEGTSLNQTLNDVKNIDNSEKLIDSQNLDSSITNEAAETPGVRTCDGEISLTSDNSFQVMNLAVQKDTELESDPGGEKKTDISATKTDATQIVADVVDSIEQESAPPVAPPRRKRKKKKNVGDAQEGDLMSPTSESPGPDSAVTTPTELPETSTAKAFATAALHNEQSNDLEELQQLGVNEPQKDDPSIHVDSNNKEMKNVLAKTSSTEVISNFTLDTKLKSGSVASLGSTKSDSYASVASSLSNGIHEKEGSFTSVASTHSIQHQGGLVRYRSLTTGRPLSDIEILEQVMVKNLDTGEAVPLSIAEEKLPKCTNPLALQIMRLTSEYSSNPDLTAQEHEDGVERRVSKKTKKLRNFFVKKGKKHDKPVKVRKDDSSSSDEEAPQDSPTPLIKIKSGHGKGPAEFEKLRILQDLSGEHVGAVWTIKFSMCGRLMATAGQDHMVRVWVLKESRSYFEEMRTKYSKPEDRSSKSEETCEEDIEMEDTLRTSEECMAGDEEEGKTAENEEPTPEPTPEEDLGPYMKTPLCTYCGHTGDVLDLSWSKNYFLLSSSMDKTVRLWHISRTECLCCFQHIDFVTAICFHPRDDRYFLSGSLDGKIRLWNIPDKKVALWNELEGSGSNLITAANFCLNGKFAAVGTYDGRCIFYETERLKYHTQWQVRPLRNKKARGRKISGIEPMPGEDKVLITSNDSRIRLYDLKDNSLYCKYKGCVNTSSQIKAGFSHDGQYVISGSEDHFVYIWRTQHGIQSARRDKNEFYESFSAHAVVVTAAMFAPVPWLIIPPDSSCQPFTTEVLVTADWSGALKLFVNR